MPETAAGDAAVRITGLRIRYGTTVAVAGLNLRAPRGAVTALVGPNGAGKTSTVEACVGLRCVESGTIEVLGRSPGDARLRGRLGVMLQDGGLYPAARPLELTRYVASLHGLDDDAAGLLEALGIDPSTRTTIKRLSGGEQQRVKCALALVARPELVFLDEPTAGLDSAGRRTVLDLLRQRRAAGTSIIITTHLMDDVERLADHVVVVARGHDVASGSVTELVGADDTIAFSGPVNADLTGLQAALPAAAVIVEEQPGRFRVATAPDPRALGAIAAWCAQHGVPTRELSVGPRSLENVVTELTAGAP